MGENRQRLDELLRHRRRATRIPEVVEAWNAVGVAASALSSDRQDDLIMRLRAAGLRRTNELPQPSTDPVSIVVSEFTGRRDMAVVVGWEVDEEPAVLLGSEALKRAVPRLRAIYPDGFLLLDQPFTSAVVIDFDEDDPAVVYVDRLSLGPVG